MIPPTILIEDTDFNAAWARAVRAVIREGVDLVIGDATEPKSIKDVCGIISLTGNAIAQIENQEIHSQYPFKHIDQYCEEFTRAYLAEYVNKPSVEKFTYLYYDRLSNIDDPLNDQIWNMQIGLLEEMRTEISSNRNQAITWKPCEDIGNASSPCLQRVWVRYLGGRDVEVHFDWRSRDCYTAMQSNIIALVEMLNREVIRPNKCKIVKIVDYSDSLHIYKSDLDAARNVKLVRVSPHGV